jgi:hypothetical protein
MKVSEMLRQAAPTYRIIAKDPLKGWLNLDKKTIYEATRHVGAHGAYWNIPSLKKDVPDYAVHVIQTDEELKKLQSKGFKE